MGRGDLPFLLQQGLWQFASAYRSSSLYHRNMCFFFCGIIGGAIYGSHERRVADAINADCAAVHISFYKLLNASDSGNATSEKLGIKEQPGKANLDKGAQISYTEGIAHPPALRRKLFEQTWGEAARLLQRQPGYNYTVMLRSVRLADETDNIERLEQKTGSFKNGVTRSTQGETNLKGVSAGRDLHLEEPVTLKEDILTDFVEMRVWDNDASKNKAQEKYLPYLQKMQSEFLVHYSTGKYRRVFDDALVRLIQ